MKRAGNPAEPAPAKLTESFGIGCVLLFSLAGNKHDRSTQTTQAAQPDLSFTQSPHT